MKINFDRNLNLNFTAYGQRPILDAPSPIFRIGEEEKKRIRKIEEKMMVTINQLEKQFEVTEKEQTKLRDMIAELKAQADEVMTPKKETYELEYPEVDDTVFLLNLIGDVVDSEYSEIAPPIRKKAFEQGLISKNGSNMVLESKRRKLMTRFNQFRNKCNGDWKPDFRSTERKHFIQLLEDMTGNILEVNYATFADSYCKFGYFKNKEDCLKAIEIFGDDIKELF